MPIINSLLHKIDYAENVVFYTTKSGFKTTILIVGKPYSLEKYRSLKAKEDLLDCALELGDGDAILAVTLMVQRSLTNQKFLGIICVRPLAAEHLVNYLLTRFQHQQVMDLLTALGNFHHAGIVGYSKAITSKVGKLSK